MIALLALGFGFVAGMLFEQRKAELGAALGAIFGKRPAPAGAVIRNFRITEPDIQPDIPGAVMTHKADRNADMDHLMGHKRPISPDNGPYTDHYAAVTEPDIRPDIANATAFVTPVIDFGRAARNVTGFVTGLLSWCARNPIVAIGLVLIVAYLVIRPFEFGKSRGELRLERDLAEANARVLRIENERDAEIAQVARDVAVIRTQIRAVSQRGHDEIAAATPDFETPIDASLAGAWRNSIERLRNACADQASADSCGSELAG